MGSVGNALFGTARQAVLRLFFTHPGERFYLRQAIRAIGLGSGAVQRELRQLSEAGVLRREAEGHQTYYSANAKCPVYQELHGLVRKTFGIAEVLTEALHSLSKPIQLAFIYGSFAGGSEKRGSDIDLMIVADGIPFRSVVSALQHAQRVLARDVNPAVYSTDEFSRKISGQHFVSAVIQGPKIFLIGGDGELRRLAEKRMASRTQAKPKRNRRSARRR